jgi:phosphoribosylaminoimidazole-succinocarboxamide synthase
LKDQEFRVALPTDSIPDYKGSVQELYFSKSNPDWIICKTTSGGSVFDVGTIFSIPGSDLCRTALRHKIYSLLSSREEWQEINRDLEVYFAEDKEYLDFIRTGIFQEFLEKGAATHHLGIIEQHDGKVFQQGFPTVPSPYVLVKRYKIIKPERVKYFNRYLWDYSNYYGADKYVIPLENIVRFGIPPGSSVYRRYLAMNEQDKRAYLESIGEKDSLSPWKMYSSPKVDFTTKYEPEDRNLTFQEALYISGCGGEKYKDIFKMTVLGSFLVHRFFRQLGLNLWDLKWEIARDGDNLVFVDTIDTDSIRVTANIKYKDKDYYINFNKQSMRDYYNIVHADWVTSIKEAKAAAEKSGKSFHHHLDQGQKEGIYPATPQVDPEFLAIQEAKFNSLIRYIYGEKSIEETKKRFSEIGTEEVKYYETKGLLDDFGLLSAGK